MKRRRGAHLRSNSAVSLVGGSKRKAVPFAVSGPGAEIGVVSAILIVRRNFDSWWAVDVKDARTNCLKYMATESVLGPSGAFSA